MSGHCLRVVESLVSRPCLIVASGHTKPQPLDNVPIEGNIAVEVVPDDLSVRILHIGHRVEAEIVRIGDFLIHELVNERFADLSVAQRLKRTETPHRVEEIGAGRGSGITVGRLYAVGVRVRITCADVNGNLLADFLAKLETAGIAVEVALHQDSVLIEGTEADIIVGSRLFIASAKRYVVVLTEGISVHIALPVDIRHGSIVFEGEISVVRCSVLKIVQKI